MHGEYTIGLTYSPDGSPERSREKAFLYRPSSPAYVARTVSFDSSSSSEEESNYRHNDRDDDDCENDVSFPILLDDDENDNDDEEEGEAAVVAMKSFRSSCDAVAVVSLLAMAGLFGFAANRYYGGTRRGSPTQQQQVVVAAPPSGPVGITPASDVGNIDSLFHLDDERGDDIDGPAFFDDTVYKEPLPPLEDLVNHDDPDDKKMREGADVSWLLDFAVIGNAKSGTTFLKNYLGKHSDEIFMDPHETCRMSNNRTDSIVKFFHDRLEEVGAETKAAFTDDGRRIKTGLKCPKETGTQWAMPNYARYFPRTDFIVTVRHPISWFQSFYNYRAYTSYPRDIPPPRELIGSCQDDGSPYVCPHTCGHIRTENVCTDRANFHHQLSRFGKTPMTSHREMKLLKHDMAVTPTESKIFLAELGQFIPENEEASANVARDLTAFLGLEKPLPSIESVGGHKRSYPTEEKHRNFIDICDEEHEDVRAILLDIGREASEWIREYFVKSPDVVVSSPEAFLDLIAKWGQDPCLERISE